jgi:hypothetical protein
MTAKTNKATKELTKEEKSLVLFLETQAVDHSGLVNTSSMNGDDRTILARWIEEGFVASGRVCSESIEHWGLIKPNEVRCLWVRLSPEAWKAAHKERIERAERLWKRREWKTTKEARED